MKYNNVIDVAKLHVYQSLEGSYADAIGKANYAWQMGRWKFEWRTAEENDDFAAMDRLQRSYEMVGMP